MDWKLEADRAEKILDNEASDEGYYNESREVAWGLVKSLRRIGGLKDAWYMRARRYKQERDLAYVEIENLKALNEHLLSIVDGSGGE